jgi:hypothetical protein
MNDWETGLPGTTVPPHAAANAYADVLSAAVPDPPLVSRSAESAIRGGMGLASDYVS